MSANAERAAVPLAGSGLSRSARHSGSGDNPAGTARPAAAAFRRTGLGSRCYSLGQARARPAGSDRSTEPLYFSIHQAGRTRRPVTTRRKRHVPNDK